MFDPYRKWLGILPKDQPPNYYRLLSIDLFESDLDVIEGAADRAMGFIRQYQSGEHAPEAARILNELATARLCLMKLEKRAAYDALLRKQLAEAATPTRTEQDFAEVPLPQDVKPTRVPTNQKRKPRKLKSATPTPLVVGGAAVACLVLYFLLYNTSPVQIADTPIESQSGSPPALPPKAVVTRTVESSPRSQTVPAKSPEFSAQQGSKTISTPNDVPRVRSAETIPIVNNIESPKAPDIQPAMKTEPPAAPRNGAGIVQPVMLRSWQAALGYNPVGIFSKDGSQIVYGAGNEVIVAKTETGENVAKLTGHKKAVWVARFCSDDRRIVSISDDSLRIWDAKTQKEVGVIKGKNNDRNSMLRATNDASMIAFSTANDRRLVVVNGATKTELGRIELTEPEVTWRDVTMDLRWGMSNGIRNQTTFWNLNTRATFQIDNGHHNYCGYFTQDGTHALLGGAYQWEIWDLETKKKSIAGAVTGGHIYALAIVPQMNRVMAGLADGTIWTFDMATGQKITSFKGHDPPIGMLVISPDEKYMISHDHYRMVHLWQLSQ